MAKTKNIFYEFYGVPREYPVYGEDDPLKPYWAWDLQRMRLEVPRLAQMGVDHVWLAGAMKSPRFDHGFDISDHFLIDQRFGDMDYEFRDFVSMCHTHGISVLVDMVLNHVSTEHDWFKKRRHPEFFWWSDEPKGGWNNLFDHGSAWAQDEESGKYYLHLFHPKQADLKWFDSEGKINLALVNEFRRVAKYWLNWMNCDGFRLDVPQSINKGETAERANFDYMLFNNSRAIEVINAVFGEPLENTKKEPILLMEAFDPTGEIIPEYLESTPVQYAMNVKLKDMPEKQMREFIAKCMKNPILQEGLVLDLESHDSMRYLSRDAVCPNKKARFGRELDLLFWTGLSNVMVYQGQELGLENPELTDEQICILDAWSAMEYTAGIPINHQTTRANARTVPMFRGDSDRQLADPESFLNRFINEARLWKKLF